MIPRHDVATRVQAQQKEDQRRHESEGPEEIDALDLRLVGLLDGDVDRDDAEDASNDDEGDLNEEGISPAEPVVDNFMLSALDRSTSRRSDLHPP